MWHPGNNRREAARYGQRYCNPSNEALALAVIILRSLDGHFENPSHPVPSLARSRSVPSPNLFEAATVTCAFQLPFLFAHASLHVPSLRSFAIYLFGAVMDRRMDSRFRPPPPSCARNASRCFHCGYTATYPVRVRPSHSKRILDFERTNRGRPRAATRLTVRHCLRFAYFTYFTRHPISGSFV